MVSNEFVVSIALTGKNWKTAIEDLQLLYPMKNPNQLVKDILAEYYRANRSEIERLKNSNFDQAVQRASNSAIPNSKYRITESGAIILDTMHGPIEVRLK